MRYKARIAVYFIVSTLYWCSLYTGVPVLTPHAKDLGASLQMVGLISGSYGLMQLLFRIPLGILSDKLGRRAVFVTLGLLFGALSGLTLLVGRSPGWVLLGRALAGVSACAYVQLSVLYASYFSDKNTSKSISIVSAATSGSQVLAMMLGGALADRFGADGAFGAGALIGLAGLVLSFLMYEPATNRMPLSMRDVARVARSPGLMGVSMLAVLSKAIWFSKVLSFVPLAAKEMNAAGWQLGIIVTLASVASAAASMAAGWRLVGLWGEKRLIAAGFALEFVACAMVPFSGNMGLILLSQALSGLGDGLMISQLMGLSVSSVASERRATAMGFFQAIYGLGMFLGPWIAGIISQHSTLDTGFYFTAALAAAGMAMSLAILRIRRTGRET